ncbi:XTP/dITP diphosphatase [Serpentinicella sp. ANB-PHB4]|nr:XTP/dITP diphosphatase [Serpentinicella sp. ANB-PHB4]MDR5658628.1 XTP/dITP diphosphatase [Serpentinicella sp. ANB-PHB4]
MKDNTVVIATNNKHKLEEIKTILQGYPYDVKSLADMGLDGLEIIEDGKTFEENAEIKAKVVMDQTGCIAIADDSGIEVDAIDKAPGIYSARFAGENATDQENNEKLLKLLQNTSIEKRTARFVSCIAMLFPNGERILTRGECEGKVGFEPVGQGGFGYDPLFIVPELQLTFAQIDAETKNKISHRGKALDKLKQQLLMNN